MTRLFIFAPLELLLIALGIGVVVWVVNRFSGRSNQVRSADEPDTASPSRTPQATSRGCLFASLGLGVVMLLVVVAVVGYVVLLTPKVAEHSEAETWTSPDGSSAIAGSPSEVMVFKKNYESKADIQVNANREATYPTGETHSTTVTSIISWAALLLLVPLLLVALAAVTIIVVSTRALRRFRRSRYDDPDSDSMAYTYRSRSRTTGQKMGLMPWVIVGLVLTLPLAVALGVLLWERPGMPVAHHGDLSGSRSETHQATKVSSSSIPDESILDEEPKTDLIDVPVDPPADTKETDTEDSFSHNDLDLDNLDGSGASLLLESIFRAAMRSIQEKSSETTTSETHSEANDKKPSNAIQSVTKALLTELPAGINEKTALESLGRFLGRAIAAESEATPQPDWINQSTGIDPKGQYRTVVTVGPYQTRHDCNSKLDDAIHEAIDDYAEIYLGQAARGRVSLSKDQVTKLDLIHNIYPETIRTSVGPMVNLHAELVFTSKIKALLEEQFRESLVYDRIFWSCVTLGGITLFLLGTLAVLKFEPLYRRRILIATSTGILLLLGLGMLFIV